MNNLVKSQLGLAMLGLALSLVPSGRGADALVRAGDMTVLRNQTNCLSIVLEARGDENAMGFSLCYDPGLLTFTSARRGVDATGASLNVNTNQLASGRVGFALALASDEAFPAGPNGLLEVCFRAANGLSTVPTPVTFCDQPIGRELVDVNAEIINAATYVNASVTVMGACIYALETNRVVLNASGGLGSLGITANAGCEWSAISTNSWIIIVSGASGSGNGSVLYSVDTNPDSVGRTGVVAIAGQIFTVIQSAAPCAYMLLPEIRAHTRDLETGVVNVMTGSECNWSVVSGDTWIVITSDASGQGNGAVNYTVLANFGFNARTGTLMIASQTFTVIQSGMPCTFSLDPVSRIHSAASEFSIVSVTAPTGCDWTIGNSNDWMIIKLSTNGTGNGIARYTVFENPRPVPRSGVLWIAGQPYTVFQSPAPCSYTLLRNSQLFGWETETGQVTVATASECTWNASTTNDWITFQTTSNMLGGGSVGFTVAANFARSDRTGIVTVAGKPFAVTQLGSSCTYDISPSSRAATITATTGTISLNSMNQVATNGCFWSVHNPNTWITITAGATGLGNGTVRYAVAGNANSGARTGVVSVAGLPFRIQQAGVPCTYSLSPSSRSHGFGAESGFVVMTAVNGCPWTARSDSSWLTITSSTNGLGNGTVTYQMTTNLGPTRIARLYFGTLTFTVTQNEVSLPFISTPPASRQVLPGATVVFNVIATGLEPLSYRWRFNGANLADGPGVQGANTPSLTLANVQPPQAGSYTVLVSNFRGAVGSSAAVLTINTAPTLAPLANRAAPLGSLLTFNAVATDREAPPQILSYSLGAGAPSGASLNPVTGVFTWTPTSVPVGSAHTVTIRVADNGVPSLSDTQTVALVIIAGVTTNISLITPGSVWKYRDTGEDLGTAWTGRTYDDTAWASGPAPLGYGNGSYATVVGFGPDSGAKNITTYFRRPVTVSDPSSFNSLLVRVQRDDGVAVYVNGAEVFRDNLPTGPLTHLTVASAGQGGAEETTFLPSPPFGSSFLVPGDNVVAVEIHQRSGTSTDINFELEMLGTRIGSAPYILDQPRSQALVAGQSATLNARAGGSAPLRYQWYFNSFLLSTATNDTLNFPSFQAGQAGNYLLVVTNLLGTVTSRPAFLTLTQIVNYPPVLAPIGNKTVTEDRLLTFTANASDLNLPSQTLFYSLGASAPAGAVIHPITGTFNWTPDETQGPATYVVTIRVTDNGSPSLGDFETILITVNESNSPPVLAPIGHRQATEGGLIAFVAEASDPDLPTQSLTYSLDPDAPDGAVIDPVTGIFTWTPTAAQGPASYTMTIRVIDSGVPAFSAFATFTISVDEVNVAPVLDPIGNHVVKEEELLVFVCRASDGNAPNQHLTFSLDGGAPGGASINTTNGLFVWTPSEAQGPGLYTVTVRVTDDGFPVFNDFETFTITVEEVNVAPTLAPIGNKAVTENQMLTFLGSASDSDLPGQSLTFSLDPGAPAGTGIHPITGVFTWLPTEAQAPGTYAVTVRVTDTGTPPLGAHRTFAITVLETNAAPILPFVESKTALRGSRLTFAAAATDADLPAQTLTYSLAAGAPAGAGIDPASGIFSWPTTLTTPVGFNVVTIRVTDNGSPPLSASRSFLITVDAGVSTNFSLIATGAVWKYRDTGENLGTNWTGTTFDDCAWASGAARLGYGHGTEATVVSFGTNTEEKPITTYFRGWFTVSDPAPFSTLGLRLLRDDGAVVYVNGVEVFRDNLPAGPIDYLTIASSSASGQDEVTFFPGPPIDPRLLVPGANLVAVEIHQRSPGSPDIGFDLELSGTVISASSPPPIVPILGDLTPRVRIAVDALGQVSLSWNAYPCRRYQVQYTTNLAAPVWVNMGGNMVASTPTASATDGTASNRQRFYRVLLLD